jgi:hypothetical protein
VLADLVPHPLQDRPAGERLRKQAGRGQELTLQRARGGGHDALVARDVAQRVDEAAVIALPGRLQALSRRLDGQARAQRQIIGEPAGASCA